MGKRVRVPVTIIVEVDEFEHNKLKELRSTGQHVGVYTVGSTGWGNMDVCRSARVHSVGRWRKP